MQDNSSATACFTWGIVIAYRQTQHTRAPFTNTVNHDPNMDK